MPIHQDLLNAAEALRKYAVTTQTRTPMPDNPPPPAPAQGQVPELSPSMGRLYDQWVSIVVRDAREVTGALDRLAMTSVHGKNAYTHLSKLTLHLQTCFEAALTTRYAAHNHYGLIVSKNAVDRPWFKSMVRRIHRAISMQMLALHVLRLEFALLLTRLDNITKRDLLPREFEEKFTEHMTQLHQYLTTQQVSMEPDVLQAGFTQNLSDLERMVAVTDEQDIPRTTYENHYTELNSTRQIVARRVSMWFADPAIAGLNPAVAAGAAQLTGAIPLGPHPGFLNMVEYARNNSTRWGALTPQVITYPHHGPATMWMDAVGQFRVKLAQMQAAFAGAGGAGAAGLVGAIPDLGRFTYPAPDTLQPRAEEMEINATPNCARFCAYDAVCTATQAYAEPNGANDDVQFFNTALSRSDDAFQLLMNSYSAKQALCAGFSPRWTTFEDRQWLAQLMERPTEYTSLFYTQANAVPGQYVMQRHNGIRITPRLIVHMWRRRVQQVKLNQRQLWALTHCEAPLMADLLYALGPIVIANRKLRLDGQFPGAELAISIKRLGLRFEPALCFENIRDATIPAAERPFWTTAYDDFRALREPDSTNGDSTQPMSDEQRTWLQAVHGVLETAWTAGAAPAVPFNPATTRWAPLIMNATRHPSYSEMPPELAVRPMAQPDEFQTHNVVCKTEVPSHIWQFVYRVLPRVDIIQRNALLSAFTFNSLCMTHFLPALDELLKIQSAIQGFPLKIATVAGQHTMEVVHHRGGHRAYRLVAGAGGVGMEPQYNDFQFETGYISSVLHNAIAGQFGAAHAGMAIRFDSATQMLDQFKTRSETIYNEYKARRAPFTAPRFWLTHDPNALPLPAGAAPAEPPWIRVDPRQDVRNNGGVIIHMPVAPGAVPAPVPADVAHANIIRAHHVDDA